MPSRAIVVALLACVACVTPTRSELAPWPAESAESMRSRALLACRDRRGQEETPPHPFTTDGCSLCPDDGWVDCCVEHDIAYWCGGSADDRAQADRVLESCVAKGSPAMAPLMWLGARVGGAPWIPVPWRWGYGWDFPSGYAPTADSLADDAPDQGGRQAPRPISIDRK